MKLTKTHPGHGPAARAGPREGAFGELQASALYCARCRGPRPVRPRLLLVLPDGELHEYLCAACGASLGTRRVTEEPPRVVLR